MSAQPDAAKRIAAFCEKIESIDNEIAWRRPLAEPVSADNKSPWAGLRSWQHRDIIHKLEEYRSTLIHELASLGHEYKPAADEVFEFDVNEIRGGRTGALVTLQAHRIQGCRHLASGKNEYEAGEQAKRDHKENCVRSSE